MQEAATCPKVWRKYHHPPGAKGWHERPSRYHRGLSDLWTMIERLAVTEVGGGLRRGTRTIK